MKHPIRVNQNHKPHSTYERDDLVDVKINRTTRKRLNEAKGKFDYKNLDELLNPAIDALISIKGSKK